MPGSGKLEKLHFFSTGWFIFCICYLLLAQLQKAGVQWWIVFSLSGHGVLLILFLITLYLFAIFRGISSNQNLEIEHPLTKTPQYALFYVITPFLGSLAGLFGISRTDSIGISFTMICLGNLFSTFTVWVIADPLIGFLETLTPKSRQHRKIRIAREKQKRQKIQQDNRRLLADIETQELENRRQWQQSLKPQAEKLAELLVNHNIESRQVERLAAEIALQAWQKGGINCMRELRDMAITISSEKTNKSDIANVIEYWWNGIGSWRSTSIS